MTDDGTYQPPAQACSAGRRRDSPRKGNRTPWRQNPSSSIEPTPSTVSAVHPPAPGHRYVSAAGARGVNPWNPGGRCWSRASSTWWPRPPEVQRAEVLEFSLGGAVAQELARRHPALVRQLVPVGPCSASADERPSRGSHGCCCPPAGTTAGRPPSGTCR